MSNSRRWRRVNKIMGWNSAFNRSESKIVKRWYTTTDERHNHLDEMFADELQHYSNYLSENAKRVNRIPSDGDICVITGQGIHAFAIGETVKVMFTMYDNGEEEDCMMTTNGDYDQIVYAKHLRIATQKECLHAKI